MSTSDSTRVGSAPDPRVERYRRAERAFWDAYDLAPADRFVEVGSPPTRLRVRVQELGSGEPVLFVNGTGGPGAYFAPLVRELRGFRCLVLDRPGWGLSAPVDYSRAPYRTLTAELLRQALDALEVDQAKAVGGSVGNLWVLRLAQAHPGRVERLVLLGGGPLTGEIGVPPFVRLLRSPLGGSSPACPSAAGSAPASPGPGQLSSRDPLGTDPQRRASCVKSTGRWPCWRWPACSLAGGLVGGAAAVLAWTASTRRRLAREPV